MCVYNNKSFQSNIISQGAMASNVTETEGKFLFAAI